jgi:hypothetical protein
MSFAAMTVTGLVLYFTPEGRVAYWVDWRFIGLTKTQWGNVHIITSLVFTGIVIYHLILNWKVFTAYLIDKFRDALALRFEMGLAFVLTLVFVVGSIFLVPPLNYVIDFSGYLKGAWVKSREYEPPFGHAEDVPLKILTKKMGIPLQEALEEFEKEKVIVTGPDMKLADIAHENRTTPMKLYRLIKRFEPREDAAAVRYTAGLVDEKFAGTGLGRKALPWILDDLQMDPAVADSRLEAQGLDVKETETLKQAADRNGVEPIDILKVILVEGYVPAR